MDALIAELTKALGADAVLTGEAAAERATSPWTRLGTPRALLRPRTTDEVATALRIAHAAGVPVSPWGGKTGLVSGARAEAELALSLDRMNAIEEIDAVSATMTVQAGCILQSACEAAEGAGLMLPLDLGARGSATIGGNISTNAGGNRVLRYGMMRDMVLGVEAVLADGTIVSSLNHLMKNNTGYDLKQLFIGSEGTLGVVTRAVLRLRSAPVSHDTALVAVDGFDQLPALLRFLDRRLGGTLSAFEVMWADFYELVTSAPAKGRAPIPYGHPYYVLIDGMGGDEAADAERFETVLGEALEDGLIADAVVAKSLAEREAIWALRDDVGQTGRAAPVHTFDVSLRISDIEAYVAAVRGELASRWADPKAFVFGHLGDGNIHLVIGVGEGGPAVRQAVEEIVYQPLAAIGGSISAEHGVGLQKRAYLGLSRNEGEIALMRTLKGVLDPKNILNPGKIFAVDVPAVSG